MSNIRCININGISIGNNPACRADHIQGASDIATARANFGLGDMATQTSSSIAITGGTIDSVAITGGSITGMTDIAVADGGTGASTASTARTNLGLGTISTQDSNAISITGGSVTGITDITITDGGTGASDKTTAFDNLAPTSTQGDIIYHNGIDNVRLAKGTASQVLTMNAGATAPEWQTFSSSGATLTRISGSSGSAGADITWQCLSSNSSDVATTTLTTVMTTTGVGSGTWHFKYNVIYQSAATGTGIGFAVNHTGTTGTYVMDWHHFTNGTTAVSSTGVQVTATTGGNLYGSFAENTKNTATFTSLNVTTANSNIMAIVEGIIVVTVSGDLQLKIKSETGTAVRLIAGSLLELHKIA